MSLILLVTLFALFGLFDTASAHARASAAGLAIEAEYPYKLRFRTFVPLTVSVRNDTGREATSLRVAFDREYLDRFTRTTFTPDVKEADAEHYTVEFENVPPGETRVVHVEYEVDQVGTFAGRVEASVDGSAPVSVPIKTLVFP